jgi:hypothetical protein
LEKLDQIEYTKIEPDHVINPENFVDVYDTMIAEKGEGDKNVISFQQITVDDLE